MQWVTGSEVKPSKDMAEEQEGQDITCQDTFDAPSSPTPANEVPINTSGEATAQEVNDAFLAEGDHLPDKVNKNSDPAEGAPAEGAPAEGDPAEGESRDVCKGDSTKIESTAETIPEKHSCPSGSTGENPSGTEADPKAATLPTLASGEEEEVDGPKVGISENSPAIKDTNNEAEEGESYPSEDSQTAELLDPDESNASASEEETKAPVVKKLDGQTSCVETIGPTITEASESAFSEADGTHGGSKRVLVVVGIVVLIAILVQHLLQPESVPPKNELQPIDLFLEQMEKVKTQYPSQRAELWKRSRLHLKRHLQTSHPTEPVSLILTAGLGAERTLNCLSQSLAFAFSSALSTSVLHIDGASKARQDSDQVKLDIDSKLQRAFEGNATVAVIHRFEELPPGSTLIFYRYCDHENAAYKKTFLIFTVLLGEEEGIPADIGLSAVEEMVDDHLQRKFLSRGHPVSFDRMDLDKYGGLWSRISHLILPVAAEEGKEREGC